MPFLEDPSITLLTMEPVSYGCMAVARRVIQIVNVTSPIKAQKIGVALGVLRHNHLADYLLQSLKI